jgi:hypothetical protein
MNFFGTHPKNVKKHNIPGSFVILYEQSQLQCVIEIKHKSWNEENF